MSDSNQPGPNICSFCGRTRQIAKSGTLTGWIFKPNACTCDLSSPISSGRQQITERLLCPECSKPVYDTKKATITQWIFRPDKCNCRSTEKKKIDGGGFDAADLQQSSDKVGAFPPSPEMLELAEQLALPERYQVRSLLGRGGVAVVCEAKDEFLNRTVAVKLIDRVLMEPDKLVRFQNEAKITSKLAHPNIVQILDFGINKNSQPYIVLEFVKGMTLRQYLDEKGPLSNESARTLFAQVASALIHSHKNGISHRDLKPENLVIETSSTEQIVPRLIDFGLASYVDKPESAHTVGTISLVGTPAYMSPDQVNGLPFDERSEIYSFGCVLFESLTGNPPFQAETPSELFAKHCNVEPPAVATERPEVKLELRKIVEKCLKKSPLERFQTFQEILDRLEELYFFSDEDENRDDSKGLEAKETERRAGGNSIPHRRSAMLLLLVLIVPLSTLLANIEPSLIGMKKPYDGARTKTLATKEREDDAAKQFSFRFVSSKPRVTYFKGSKVVKLEGELKTRDYAKVLSYPDALGLETDYQQHIDLDGFKLVSRLPLKHLNLRTSDADDRTIEVIAKMPTVTRVLLDKTEISDKCLPGLVSLPHLQELVLNNCNLTDSGIETLTRSKSLRNLSLNGIQSIKAKGLSSLSGLKLTNLSLSSCNHDIDAIKAISRLNAKNIYLAKCSLDDERIRFFNNRTVKKLDLSNNAIGERGLQSLLRLPSIESITLSSSLELTPKNVARLKESIQTRCQVYLQ